MEKIISSKQKCILFFIAVTFLAVCSIIFVSLNKVDAKTQTESIEKTKEKKNKGTEVYVDLKGEVNNPGVYKININSRINDVINVGGGLTKNGSTKNINLSKKVEDEMVVIVSKASEIKSDLSKTDYSCNNTGIYINSCLKNNNTTSTISSNNSSSTNNSNFKQKSTVININTATKDELNTLSGIGESKAEAIIKYREESGLFKSIEDIKNVTGIGDALFAKIKENITV